MCIAVPCMTMKIAIDGAQFLLSKGMKIYLVGSIICSDCHKLPLDNPASLNLSEIWIGL